MGLNSEKHSIFKSVQGIFSGAQVSGKRTNLKLPEISGLLFVIIAAHELQLIRKDSCRWLWLPFRSVRVSLAAPVYYSVNFFSSPTLKTTEPPNHPISPNSFALVVLSPWGELTFCGLATCKAAVTSPKRIRQQTGDLYKYIYTYVYRCRNQTRSTREEIMVVAPILGWCQHPTMATIIAQLMLINIDVPHWVLRALVGDWIGLEVEKGFRDL